MSDKTEGYKIVSDNRQARYLYEILKPTKQECN
jgi:SsrA-binding protein